MQPSEEHTTPKLTSMYMDASAFMPNYQVVSSPKGNMIKGPHNFYPYDPRRVASPVQNFENLGN